MTCAACKSQLVWDEAQHSFICPACCGMCSDIERKFDDGFDTQQEVSIRLVRAQLLSEFGGDFDTPQEVSLRLVRVQLLSEAPGYRDLELSLRFSVCSDGDHIKVVTRTVRLSPVAFEQLWGILNRSVSSWSTESPNDINNCPHHRNPL